MNKTSAILQSSTLVTGSHISNARPTAKPKLLAVSDALFSKKIEHD